MTRGPRRLKDDPDFKWETGCDVADESRLVGDYDLQGTRSRLLAAIALAHPPVGDGIPENPVTTVGDGIPVVRPGVATSGWGVLKPLAVAVTGAFVVAASYWVGVQVGSDKAPAELVPVEAPAVEATTSGMSGTSAEIPAPALEAVATTSAPGTAEPSLVVSRPSIAKTREVRQPVNKLEPVAAPAPELPSEMLAAQHAVVIAEQAAGTSEAPEADSVPGPRSTLKEQIDAFGKAEDALYQGDYDGALALYDAYLTRFPQGKHVVEVQLGRLQALFGTGDKAATEAFARSIQDLPSLSGRRAEILQLRAESLVLLDRCEEALLVAGEIPSKAAAEVRRICRRSGKESP